MPLHSVRGLVTGLLGERPAVTPGILAYQRQRLRALEPVTARLILDDRGAHVTSDQTVGLPTDFVTTPGYKSCAMVPPFLSTANTGDAAFGREVVWRQ